jgi:hypothetical protein
VLASRASGLESEAENKKNPEEFRPYRLALWIVYVSVGGLGALLLITSIVVELFGRRSDTIQAPSPADLLTCNDDVVNLLDRLANTSAEIQTDASKGVPATELGTRWEEFSRGWDRSWNMVNAQCRFDELAETGLGRAVDRLAWVHRNLPGLKLQYREMMKQFSETQAPTLAEMREALSRSRKLLQEQAGKRPAHAP